MKKWDNKPYYSLDYYYKKKFGEKVYKLSLDAGMTCPNRDGKISTGGCIFCSEGGSGDNAGDKRKSIAEQLEDQRNFIRGKYNGKKFIAYFQAFTNTYADINYLKKVYYEALSDKEVVGISIATRPDCLDRDVMRLLEEIALKKPLWVELGLQTIHDKTAKLINRGYDLEIFDEAVKKLNSIGAEVIVHLILGLPYETKEEMLESVKYMNDKGISGVKLQLLHILKNTKLADLYEKKPFHIFEMEEYGDFVIECIENLRDNIVIHRLTGDGPSDLLVAPIWSLKKINLLNYVHHKMKVDKLYQGKIYDKNLTDIFKFRIDTMYKLMILYLIEKTDKSLNNTEIMTFFPKYEYTDYFRVQVTLSELIESKQIIGITKYNKTTYFITNEGKEVLSSLMDTLSEKVIKDLDKYIFEINRGLDI